jgi:hypothetical protein
LTDTQDTIEIVRRVALQTLEELFVQVHHMMLDPEDPMFITLASVSAEQASRPVGTAASLAAQVDHTGFYIDTLLARKQGADWSLSWSITETNDEGWEALKDRLQASYEALRQSIITREIWTEDDIEEVFCQVGHAAYHLGQIREALAILGQPE